MNRRIITYTFFFIFLVLLQATVLNDIALFGYATPLLYICFILKLPSLMATNGVMTIAFFMGLIVDIFSNTPGMNAFAATTMAFMRKPVMSLVLPRSDEAVSVIPSMTTFGVEHFIGYTVVMVFQFCLVLFLIDAFTFFNPLTLLLRFLSSALLTFALILAVDCLKPGKK
ncbi:MAG: rod shape-determining protein MreD [Coprobacter sp.]|nr:rod shape-determining protein MreD [Coprobacter sp.]